MEKKHAQAVILTVGTTEQKKLCEKLVADLKDVFQTEIIVVSDEDFGGRIGSGGALIGAVEKFYEPDKKMLVINSGGFSKRNINYSVRGKLFANLLIDGKETTLLELLVLNGKNLFSFIESGVIVCCSDILVSTENCPPIFNNNFGICVRADFETASRHGVMYKDKSGLLDIYPHKTDSEALSSLSSQYGENGALVDTGIIYFSNDVCLKLKTCEKKEKIVRTLAKNNVNLNLYPDIVALFANKVNREEYLSHSQSESHKEIKEKLFDLLSDFSLEPIVLEGQDFIHIGSLKEALENIIKKSKKNHAIINSFADEKSVIDENTVLDNVILEGCTVGENCLITDITLEDVNVGKNTSVCGIKLKDGSFIAIVCSVEENPKEKNGDEQLWDVPRFYKGKSFTDSFMKFMNSADEEKFSMSYCTENADAEYYIVRQRYLRDKSTYSPNKDYIKLREEILKKFFSENVEKKQFECVREKVEINLPVRVNLSGTWTDAMPYCIYNGGEVINAAVTVDGEKPIRVVAEKLQEKHIEFCSDGIREKFDFTKACSGEDLSDFNLHKSVLTVLGITKKTKLIDGFRLTTDVSLIDKGSGLGTSSILLGGCFKAIGILLGSQYTEDEIFEMVFVAEQIMKTGGGWQDQVGGLIPGMKITSSDAGIQQKLSVKKINLSEEFERFISEKFILIPTGQRHFGRFIVNDVAARYLEKNEEALCAYEKIKLLNRKFSESFEKENISDFLKCLNEHHALLKKISPAVSDEKIETLINALLKKHVDAVSICGAGGGGYLLSVMKDNVGISDVQKFIKTNFSYITGDVKKIDISY